MRHLGKDGEWPGALMHFAAQVNFVNSHEICASVPPCTSPPALHSQGDPQTSRRRRPEGGGGGRGFRDRAADNLQEKFRKGRRVVRGSEQETPPT